MSIAVRVGSLDQEIKIYLKSTGVDEEGQPLGDDDSQSTLVDTIRAAIIPMKGGEKFASNRELGKTYARCRIRYYPNLTLDNHRIEWSGQMYDIINIQPEGQRLKEYLLLLLEDLESSNING